MPILTLGWRWQPIYYPFLNRFFEEAELLVKSTIPKEASCPFHSFQLG
jgi:hypothetical protein